VLGALALVTAAAGLAWYGQPSALEKWQFLAAELEPRLVQREVQIDPAEMLELMHDDYVDLRVIDVRDERDWNLFHLWGSQRITLDALEQHRKTFSTLPGNGVIVFVSNDEIRATEAWKRVMAIASKPNAYILAGGINRWLDEFTDDASVDRESGDVISDDSLRHPLQWAMGSRHPAALPDPHYYEQETESHQPAALPDPHLVEQQTVDQQELDQQHVGQTREPRPHDAMRGPRHNKGPGFRNRVKLQKKVIKRGGCG
jgi:rhodanese-related sulfurtransferase